MTMQDKRLDFQAYEERPTVAQLLRHHLTYRHASYSQVAERSSVAVSYVFKLVNGHKLRPSRDTLIRLGWALDLSASEMDGLLLAADYAPLFYR